MRRAYSAAVFSFPPPEHEKVKEGLRLHPSVLTFGRIIAACGLRFPADPRSRLGAYDVFSATAFLKMWRVICCGSLLKTGSSVYLAGS